MIFATLQKCGGNKTRAAALLGVSLKTLYNRLNAYRAQGLAMDHGLSDGRDVAITTSGAITGSSFRGNHGEGRIDAAFNGAIDMSVLFQATAAALSSRKPG